MELIGAGLIGRILGQAEDRAIAFGKKRLAHFFDLHITELETFF